MDKKKTVVVALGHRALGSTLPEQQRATKEAAKAIADLAETGANVVISHSNSQQVGMIHMAMNEFAQNHPEYTTCPMSVCSAMSQGYIGYDLQNAIRAELITRGIYRPVSTVLTQVLVDPYDEAFYEPTKIIGRLLTKEEADAEEKKGNFVTKVEDGFRRIVASPAPKEIIELDAIKALVKDDQIVICCGGGGIPVMEQGVDLRGASAVVEKDLIAGLLAIDLSADTLMILTSVDAVALNYRSDNEKMLGRISVHQARSYLEENQFEKGSMRPKFEAAINFVELGASRRAIITSIPRARAAYLGKAGTEIVNEV
ncbi:MAG: carbamate kinase [Clostridiales bacterium]|jgi:carbamate kinase|uniref:carbamate kinase n=1 Tax=Chordicoccus furentiruminis TaxID=2709410 RepID=UPI0023A83177|nr:carbamate kinase [Chordicoccus furentiruminis]MCI6174788.1 carbamate kinase [Clostridiales bacterium]